MFRGYGVPVGSFAGFTLLQVHMLCVPATMTPPFYVDQSYLSPITKNTTITLEFKTLSYTPFYRPFTAALVISSRHRSRLTYGGLLFLLICVTSLGRYAWSPLPAARLSESAGSRVGALD